MSTAHCHMRRIEAWWVEHRLCRIRQYACRHRYLGQLLDGQDSIQSFERGIAIMRDALQGEV